ncbi:MAG: TIGR03118 family protein [Candidatus Binatus sp.]
MALSVVTFAVMMVAAQVQSTLAASSTTSFKIVKLVGSKGSGAKKKDARMVNAWGTAFIAAAATPFWVNDEGTGDSELIDGKGKIFKALPFVTVPGASGGTGKPTGIVGNATGLFPIPGGTSADFIFATDDGTIAGWNSGTSATTIVNNSTTASYTGLALAANMLYAANHKAPGSIDVFDANFNPISTTGGFSDPSLPAGFTPYNITALGDSLFVAYSEGTQAVGQVDEFDTEGNLIMSFTDPSLDEPWGLTLAPSQFGTFSNDLLVGNLGDGTISVFNPANGEFLGQLEAKKSKPLVISGLWSLVDGTGAMNAKANAVYFTAGPAGYTEGLFGMIQAGSAAKKTTSTPMPGPYTLMPGMM